MSEAHGPEGFWQNARRPVSKHVPPRRVWFFAYTWAHPGHHQATVHQEHGVTDVHPLLVCSDWQDTYNGNSNAHLVSWQEITDELARDANLRAYVYWCIDENGGELGTGMLEACESGLKLPHV